MHADGKERSQNDLLNNFNTPPQKKVLMRNRENKQMRKR